MRSFTDLDFDNSFARLNPAFYQVVDPTPLSDPHLVAFNPDAAGLIDLNIQRIVSEISGMFESKAIEDSKLRKLLLELRRAFVRHNIFPFSFIVIQEDTPYLFLYPETIIKRFKFPATAWMESQIASASNRQRFMRHR